MFNRSLGFGLLASVGLACVGCWPGHVSFSYHEDEPAHVVHVHRHTAHVCTHDCHDHHWDGEKVVVISGHRHGAGCGHHWDGSHWGVVKTTHVRRLHRGPRVVKVKHVHSASCGCVYDRPRHTWVRIKKRHVHSPGCGHVYVEGRWSIRF